MKNITMMLALAALASTVLVGCDSEDTKTYDVPITWNVGGGLECTWSVQGGTLVELDEVTVTVYENEDDEEPMDAPVPVSCSDFEYTIPRLKRGTYWVKVQAWGEYDGNDLPILVDEAEVRAPYKDSHDNDFTLFLAPGDIHVTWSFENGLMCGPNEIENIDISLADEDVACDDGEYTVEDKPGFSEYNVMVNALDADDDVLFTGEFDENPFLLLPGETYEVHVVLEEI